MIRLALVTLVLLSFVDTADARRRRGGSSHGYTQSQTYRPAAPVRRHVARPRRFIAPFLLGGMLMGGDSGQDYICVQYDTGLFCTPY